MLATLAAPQVRSLEETKANNLETRTLYWHTLAINIDHWCLLIFSTLYTLALIALHLYRDQGRTFFI